MNYQDRYKNLNVNQKKAVDTIEGPVMVIAGPGTGKTELLSMRAANILKQTDVLPENILCLTFTDSGSVAMQKRLTSIIGRNAYNVSIYTFHSFGSEIMSRYREYFFNGAEFRPADALNQHKIITDILDTLEYNDPLRSRMNNTYTNIPDILKAISDLKRAGLTDAEFLSIIEANELVIDSVNPLIEEAFSDRVNKTSTPIKLQAVLAHLESIDEPQPISSLEQLSTVLSRSLERALNESVQHSKVTPPLTTWKNEWFDASTKKLKIAKQQKKLRSLCYVYGRYLQIMQEAELYDFDDMIMQVVHAIEVHDDLRYDLQEKFQYIMVDEFQDTNMAQMRILHNLTNNPASEGSPNILVVGDDDQAIYGFQGADVGNILSFKDRFKNATLVTLTDNYRSAPAILSSAQQVISQSEERLSAHIPTLDKTLTAHYTPEDVATEFITHPSLSDQHYWIAQHVKKLISDGAEAQSIAILGKKHEQLEALIGWFAAEDIAISYDKRDNVLEDEVVMLIELISRVIVGLHHQEHDDVNALLPELLSHPAWGIEPTAIWRLSLDAYKGKKAQWLEIMQTDEKLQPLFSWLIACSQALEYTPLERMLDYIIGSDTLDSIDFTSPIKEHFFGTTQQEENSTRYVTHLQNLIAIRNKLREHDPDTTTPRLYDFLHFIEQCNDTNTKITSLRQVGDKDNAVQLMTAHGAKGLEFDHVVIIDANDSTWGQKARSASSSITFAPNMLMGRAGSTYSERLRLFFVAMTRAKKTLHITQSLENKNGKELLEASFLVENTELTKHVKESSNVSQLQKTKQQWYAPIVTIPHSQMNDFLADTLRTYKLSATHINNFTDVSNGGPQGFLLNNLLHFPSSIAPHAAYGTAIHTVLQREHDYIRANKHPRPQEDILSEFEKELQKAPLTQHEYSDFLQKGGDSLRAFLDAKHANFTPHQRAEVNFIYQDSFLNDTHLTGKIDVADFNEVKKTVHVIDYKTGSPLKSWDKGESYVQIKAHKYRQQLLFYRLLIETSRDWRQYTMTSAELQFVEPDKHTNEIKSLALDEISDKEYEDFKLLVRAIAQHITSLNFIDTSEYSQDIAGVIAFEEYLRNSLT